jgi:hypothetical protein
MDGLTMDLKIHSVKSSEVWLIIQAFNSPSKNGILTADFNNTGNVRIT